MSGLRLDKLRSNLAAHGRPLGSFAKGDRITGSTGMALAKGYSYVLEATPGSEFADGFQPDLTPGEILMLGAFEGRYLNDCVREFPLEWFVGADHYGRLSPDGADPARCNLFGIKSRQSLPVWKQNGWAPSRGYSNPDDHYHGLLGDPKVNPDERGWFQWYCRYWMGRRIPVLDKIQIGRWRSFRRHAGAIRAGCATKGDLSCRPKERQALLQWAYDPFI